MSTLQRKLAASDLQLDISELIGPRLQQLQAVAIVAAIAGAVLCVLGYITHPAGFFHSYLVGLIFWVGASTGSLALLMLHHTTGGGWGYILRRFFEAATLMIPWMLVLSIPLFIGVYLFGQPYVWARPEEVMDPVIKGKFVYLNKEFFIVRTILYFAVWSFFGWLMR